MSVKTGWLKDHNGDKFAPKTYASQVVDINGTPIEDKVNEISDLLDEYIANGGTNIVVDQELSSTSENPVQNKVIKKSVDELQNNIDTLEDDIELHSVDTNIHVTAEEKNTWNNKSDFSGSYNDLEDKPFSSEITEGVLEFNGDYENYPLCEGYDMTYVKISDRVLSREELLGAEYTICIDTDVYYDPRGTYTFTVDEQSLLFNQVVEDEFNNYSRTDYSVYHKGYTALISVSEISGDAPLKLEIGTYFMYKQYGDGSIYVKSISCLTGDVEKVNKIDPKYLPEVRFNDLKDRPCGVNIVDGVEKVRQLDKKFIPTLKYTDLEDTPCKLRGIPVEYSGNLEDYKYYDVTGGSKIQCFVKISEKTYSKYDLSNASYT